MLPENWLSILFFSFCAVAVANALLASCTKIYYKEKSWGQLSHSQLRIKQGNATIEHRLNVLAHSIVFGLVSLRIYLFTLILWVVIVGSLFFISKF